MLAERAFRQAASVTSRLVSFASPCCSMSRSTLFAPAPASERANARVNEPLRTSEDESHSET
jgi:hypothetical protein